MVLTLRNTDPTMINVLTDAALLVLNICWYQMMAWLTSLNLQRDLRKGTRIFSFEHLGSLENFRFGRTKYRYLKRKKMLDDPLQRQFRWQTFVSILFLLCSVALVLLHVLIDYGLDFAEVTDDWRQANFSMIGLSRSDDHRDAISKFRIYRELPDFCSRQIANKKQNCLDVAMNTVYWTQSRSREKVVLAKTLFQAPSILDLDLFENIEMDYIAYDSAGQPCTVMAGAVENEFTGAFLFDKEDCVLEESHVRKMTIDMRAKIVTNLRLIVVASMQQVFSRIEFPHELHYNSFVTAKEKTLDDTSVAVAPLPLENVAGDTNGRVRVDVDSKLRYLPGQQQTLTFTDLSRVATGESADQSFSIAFGVKEARQVKIGGLCPFLADPDRTILGTSESPLDIMFEGTVCGNFVDVTLSAEDCEDPIRVNGVSVGVQTLRGVVMIDQNASNECLEQIQNRYAEFPPTDGSFHRYIMTFEMDIICQAAVDNGSLVTCAYGSETFTWTDEAGWIPYDSSDADAIPVNMRSKISVLRLEVNGGLESEVGEVFDEMNSIFRQYYPELKYFTDETATRARLFGADLSLGMTSLMAGVSSQISVTTREILAPNKFNAAVLRVEYFIGAGTVLLISVVALLFTLYRQIQENLAYKKLGVRVRVPTTITGWIAAALTQESELDDDGNTFEFTSRKIAGDAKQSSQSFIGFSKFIEPLRSRNLKEESISASSTPTSPRRQDSSESNPTLEVQAMRTATRVTFEDPADP